MQFELLIYFRARGFPEPIGMFILIDIETEK